MGMTEKEAGANPDVLIGEFPFTSLGMAQVLGKTEGSVKIFIDKNSHKILGARIRGFHAEELTRVIALAMNLGAKVEDLVDLVYAHPTLPEAIGEAAESALGNAIHLMPEKPSTPEEAKEYDVVVVGAGPAGYVAAIRAAQLGKKVAVIEKDRPGGTCLIRGCIPTKTILEAIKSEEDISLSEIRKRVEKIIRSLEGGIRGLLRANRITLIEGEADISKSSLTGDTLVETRHAVSVRVDERSISAKNVILAMGSEPASLPGLKINHRNIIDSNDALKLEIPDELTIVGAGSIGLEFATIYKSLGCKKVTVIEKEEQICPGVLDRDMARILQKKMETQGVTFELGKGFDVTNIPEGKVLIAVGRAFNTQRLVKRRAKGKGLGAKSKEQGKEKKPCALSSMLSIVLTEKGSVEVNDQYQVKLSNGEYAENLFAVGDIVGGQLLAHKGSKEGRIAAETAAKIETHPVDYNQIPSVIFSIPEVASVGLTGRTQGSGEHKVRPYGGGFKPARTGKSIEVKYLQTSDGKNMVKVILDTGYSILDTGIEHRESSIQHPVLGVIIIGPSAPYAIAEMTLAVRMGATLKQLMKEGLTLASAKEISSLEEWEEKLVETRHAVSVRSTPLTEIHREVGAKMDNFHGWWVPMRYTDAYEEVFALRNNAAIWDIGHMAVLEVSGEEAKSFLQFLTTNDIDRLKVGQVQYSFFLDEKARPLDDILVYRPWEQRYLIVVNAANREKIKRWLFSILDTGCWIAGKPESQKAGKPALRLSGFRVSSIEHRVSSIQYPVSSIEILDLYDCPEEDKRVTLFSLQGPKAEDILKELTDFDLDALEYFHIKKIKVAGKRMLVQRGGYSGEEGFELFVPAEYAVELWGEIMEAGKQFGLKPAGLVARDIARQEACLPLYGNEWPEIDLPPDSRTTGQSESRPSGSKSPLTPLYKGGNVPASPLSEPPLYITPYEAGFGWAVKVNKGEFMGREAYIRHLDDIKQGKIEGYTQVAIEIEGRWTAYQNYRVFVENQEAGLVTSGRFSKYLGKSVWLAYVKTRVARFGLPQIPPNPPLQRGELGASRVTRYPLGQMVEIEIGKERVVGKIVPKPFVNNIIYPRRGDMKENAKYYITLTPKQIDEMLHDTIGADSIDELLPDSRLSGSPAFWLSGSPGLSRRKNYRYHAHLAGMNYSPKEYSSFLGAGSYDYKIPDVVDWAASLRGIYTPYTPYQAEVAQGLLRLFHIYQSQICQLTGMEVANASLYDGATALAEAAFMSARITSVPSMSSSRGEREQGGKGAGEKDGARNVFLVAGPLHPFYYQVLETYAKDVGCKVVQVPFDEEKGTINLEALQEKVQETGDSVRANTRFAPTVSRVACVIVQQPNFFGQIESKLHEIAEITHDVGALFISCTTDPHSLEILEAPAHYGADIAVGEAQAFGNPVNCGGPNLGFLATSKQYIKEVPGRIVGRTETDGEETFCLIRQTREQHITRFKAKSNICSNTALCATRAALYMLAQGRVGLHEINSTTLTLKEFFLNQLLAIPGFELAFEGDSFNEVTVRVPIDPGVINEELLKRKCLVLDAGNPESRTTGQPESRLSGSPAFRLSGFPALRLSSTQYMLFSFTNRTTEAEIENLIDALMDIVGATRRVASTDVREKVLRRREEFTGEIKYSPKEIQRTMPLNLPQYSESSIIRFAKDMADLNIDIDAPLYPLGSCTMKYNPKLNEKIAALEGFSRVHPLAPDCAKQGTLKLAYDFSQYLCQITGMDAVTLQPEAGAHGEFTGLKVIRAALDAGHGRTQGSPLRASSIKYRESSIQHRDLIITSDSSHGTNPASVSMTGMEILEIPSDKYGMIDVETFRKAVEYNKDRFAGCMLTIPNTLGIFEPDIPNICQITHEYGGYVYMDGANFNALIGQIKVRDLGIDVMHFNLHKTFSTPHGGGGPGAGPIAVKAELEPYLPIPRVRKGKGEHKVRPYYWLDYSNYPHSIGKVGTFFGPYNVVIKANAYRMTLGDEGMRKVSEAAILNANYMLKRIMSEAVDENGAPLFKMIYKPGQYCMHEFVISSERFEKHGLSAIDFAKGVIDFGVYAPTVGFPLFFDHGRHAIMVEPTDTAAREGMDYFCDKFIELARKAWENPEVLKSAPSKLRFRRISIADADRKLDVRSNIRELLPDYTPISGGEVVEEEIVSFVKRKVITQMDGLNIPEIPEEIDPAKAKFMEEGEWVFDLGGGFALCGLSKETTEMIKTLKFSTIHLPKLGVKIKQGEDTGASVDFDKVASPIYAPVSGTVVKINPLLVDEENLDILIDEPYKRGWLFVVQMDNPEAFYHPLI